MTDVSADSAEPYVLLTHGTEQGRAILSISWHDAQDQDGLRPGSVLVDLYKQVGGNEPLYVKSVTISAGRDNMWRQVISDLPIYEDGA